MYVVGSGITGASIPATAPFTAVPPGTIHHASPISIAVAVHGTVPGAPTSGTVTFSTAYGSTNVTATSGTATGTLVLSGFPNVGTVTVPVNVIQGGTIIGRIVLTMNVTT